MPGVVAEPTSWKKSERGRVVTLHRSVSVLRFAQQSVNCVADSLGDIWQVADLNVTDASARGTSNRRVSLRSSSHGVPPGIAGPKSLRRARLPGSRSERAS